MPTDDKFNTAYKIPKGEYARLPIKTTSVIKEKPPKEFWIDEFITKRTKKLPSPDKYIKTNNWCEMEKGIRPKGKFMLQPK